MLWIVTPWLLKPHWGSVLQVQHSKRQIHIPACLLLLPLEDIKRCCLAFSCCSPLLGDAELITNTLHFAKSSVISLAYFGLHVCGKMSSNSWQGFCRE